MIFIFKVGDAALFTNSGSIPLSKYQDIQRHGTKGNPDLVLKLERESERKREGCVDFCEFVWWGLSTYELLFFVFCSDLSLCLNF